MHFIVVYTEKNYIKKKLKSNGTSSTLKLLARLLPE